MAKIAFIGAGSFGFTRGLVKDILTFPLLKDATLVLMDIDRERLAFIKQAVEAALTGNPRLVFHSIAYDPLTAAVLSLSEIKEMTQAMLNRNRPYLPQFKKIIIP